MEFDRRFARGVRKDRDRYLQHSRKEKNLLFRAAEQVADVAHHASADLGADLQKRRRADLRPFPLFFFFSANEDEDTKFINWKKKCRD